MCSYLVFTNDRRKLTVQQRRERIYMDFKLIDDYLASTNMVAHVTIRYVGVHYYYY